MRKVTTFLLWAVVAMLGTTSLNAQSLNVVRGNVSYCFSATNTGVMNYAEGKTVTIQGFDFDLDAIDRMEVVSDEMDDNTVLVEYASETAHVTIAGNLCAYVAATVEGAHVSIVQSADVSDKTCGEITYILKGESEQGAFTMEGSYKSTIELSGLTLTNPSGAVIDIQNGKRIELKGKEGTVNTLVDGASGSQKGCIYCKGHLELKGKGTLSVTGKKSHAISAKEYVSMKNCTVNIVGAVKDGINCGQYFLMESGALNISGTGDDGIQASFKDDADREAEDTGSIDIKGGTLNIAVTATAAKALKADGDFTMSGGEIVASTSGGGEWNSEKQKTSASSCISADGIVEINGGTLNLTSTGGGGKGISCDGSLTINGGTLTIKTSGGMVAYTNGTLNQNYTGRADNLNSDYKSSPKGIKADGNITINGGNIHVTTTGNGGEGIESKAVLTVNDGNITVRAYDDAINSSSHMYIKGGNIDVIATNNDGLDSNGNLYIQGGIVRAFGASAPECGLDANEEEGYTVYFTGGMILAAGGGNSVPTKSGSTQPYVSTNITLTAGSTVSIGTSSETLYTFDVPSDYKSSGSTNGGGGNRPGGGPGGGMGGGGSVLISVPSLVSGSSYIVKSGSSSTSATAKLTK